MSVTATPNLASTPPRIELSITSSSGNPITGITLTRTANGVTETTRVQPTAGPSPRIVNDAEAPWNTTVVYNAYITTATGTETHTSPAVTLSPTAAWIIHPTTPALSRILDAATTDVMGVSAHGSVSRPAEAATPHTIIGSKYRQVTVSGPRSAARTSLTVTTVTAAEQQALWALLEDLTAVLIRVPPAWLWDWEDGYYQVFDVDASRLIQYGAERRRSFNLSIERVEAPAGTTRAERTCADVLAAFGTSSAVVAAYATCTDLLTDTRR